MRFHTFLAELETSTCEYVFNLHPYETFLQAGINVVLVHKLRLEDAEGG